MLLISRRWTGWGILRKRVEGAFQEHAHAFRGQQAQEASPGEGA